MRSYGGKFDAGGLVRAARRRADCSQRELAQRAGLSRSTVARVESGALRPSVRVLRKVLAVAGLELVAVDAERRVVEPMRDDRDDMRDGAERRYPSHLDVVLDPRRGEWWGDRYGLTAPPETFYRDRRVRDAARRRSRWEVRVAQCRHLPPPPRPAPRRSPVHWPHPPDPGTPRLPGTTTAPAMATPIGSAAPRSGWLPAARMWRRPERSPSWGSSVHRRPHHPEDDDGGWSG